MIINGHPDPRPERFCAALVTAYASGAVDAGRAVRRIDVGSLDFTMIRSRADFMEQPASAEIAAAQAALRWADHVLIVYPLWLGNVPAILKGFLEQVCRYGVALSAPGQPMKRLLRGKSARVVVTMGMPAFAFRWLFGGYGVKALERGLLWISGISPIRRDVIGGVESASAAERELWLARMRRLGARD